MSATALSSWARSIRRAVERAGVDPDPLFVAAGLDPAALADPNARYPVRRTAELWRRAVQATGNPALGLDVARQVTPTTFHALGYAQVASANLREAFERAVRYFRIVADTGELAFERDGPNYALTIRVPAGEDAPAVESIDAFVAVFVRMVRGLAGRDADPLRVELARPSPNDPGPWQRAFRVMPEFGAVSNRIEYPAALIERPLETANPELARHNDAVVIAQLARLQRQGFTDRVRAVIVETLPDGPPTGEAVAARLHLSARSLQRRLADEGTSFSELLDATRLELARSYLEAGTHTVGEVTFLLGYSDASAFSRAFKRWTGVAPSAWPVGTPSRSRSSRTR